jgi:hypothetical protein
MYKHDQETLDFLGETKAMIFNESANIVYILNELKKKDSRKSLPTFLACNFFSVGSQMLAYQIWWNLENGNLLIALIGLRSLFEDLINVRFIYYHPKHEDDLQWTEEICNDFLQRSKDQSARKSKLGEATLLTRAKQVEFEQLYFDVYADLCNYSHFLANSIDVFDPLYYKGKTIESAIYVLTCYHDLIAALSSFLRCKFVDYINEIKEHKMKGIEILKRIRILQDERKAQLEKLARERRKRNTKED